MAFQLSRVDRIERDYTLTAVDKSGNLATLSSIQVALLPIRTGPTVATTWTTLPVTAGLVTVVFAAPDATPQANDLRPVGETDLHMREVDGALIKAVKVERITVT